MKKVVFNGVEISQGDSIAKDLKSEVYLVVDFENSGRPICIAIGSKNTSKIPYPYEEIVKIGGFLLS